MDPNLWIIKQKRRTFDPKRYEAIKVEVDKLLMARLIKEAFYPSWLLNAVLIKKSNGK